MTDETDDADTPTVDDIESEFGYDAARSPQGTRILDDQSSLTEDVE